MKLPNKDDPIRIYLSDNPSSATQLVWKEELLTPKQYGMKLKKRNVIKRDRTMSKAEEIHYKAVIAADNQEPPKDYAISAHADHFNGFVEGFIEGYNQAEKDLSDISWIKEISGVKDMSRAKEEALKAFPPRSIAANYDTIDRRDAFEYGYLKAEKDLELTWENMFDIFRLVNVVLDDYADGKTRKEVGEEVLRRFNKQRDERSI
jgi:hypothetical protein